MQKEVTEKIVPECVGGVTNMLFSFAEIKRRMKEIKNNYPEYESFYFSFFTDGYGELRVHGKRMETDEETQARLRREAEAEKERVLASARNLAGRYGYVLVPKETNDAAEPTPG